MTAAERVNERFHAAVADLDPNYADQFADVIFDARLAVQLRELRAIVATAIVDLTAELEREHQMFIECVTERDAARLLIDLCHF